MKISLCVLMILCTAACGIGLQGADSTAEHWIPAEHPASLAHYMTAPSAARYRMDIAAAVSGHLAVVNIDVGDVCTKDSQIALNTDTATLNLQLARQRVVLAQLQHAHAHSQSALTQATLAFQQTEYQRLHALEKHGAHSASVIAASALAVERARTAHEAQLLVVQQAQQHLRISEQHTRLAQDTHAKHHPVLPLGWTVSARHMQPHSFVAAGQPIISLADMRTLTVRLLLNEHETQALLNQEHIVLNFAHAETAPVQVQATIQSLSPSVIGAHHQRALTLVFPNNTQQTLGGRICSLTLRVPDSQQLRIPLRFINNRFGQNRIRDRHNTWIPIVISRTEGDMAIVSRQQIPANCTLVLPPHALEGE